MRTNNP